MAAAVSVCVAATRPSTLQATLRSLNAQTFRDWELILVAQGDLEGLSRVAERWIDAGRLHFVPMQTRGLSRARNAALRAASGEVLAMTDDDCEASPGWLEAIVSSFAEDRRLGLLGGAVEAPPAERRGPRNCPQCDPPEILHDPANGEARPSGCHFIGANFAVRRSAAALVGDFDELLGAGSPFPVGEEIDYMLRAETLGVRLRTTSRALVRHTFGWRYGVRAVMRHQRDQARGNGALAAKLTLAGDGRGTQALDEMRRLARVDWLQRRRPVALPAGLRRLHHFATGYRECLAGFRLDSRGMLTPKFAETPG